MSSSPLNSAFAKHRQAGVCLHLTALPGDQGIGVIGAEARQFVDAVAAANLQVWQFLPVSPTGFGDSPYQATSSFAGNEMLIDIAGLVALGLLRRSEIGVLGKLPAGKVDFAGLIPAKTQLLTLACERFDAGASPAMKLARDAFVAEHDGRWLHDYALFRYLKTAHGGGSWQGWEKEYAQRAPASLRRIARRHSAKLASIKTRQFLFEHQWQALYSYAHERKVRLFGDMPIYLAMDSADTWANRDLLQLDEQGQPDNVAGVPPDYFSKDGQLWGNPLYDWAQQAGNGYEWWSVRLRQALRRVDLLRLDHFRGFEAYWSVPANDATARNGQWRPGPGRALFDALRSSMGSLPLVAEDLGVITDAVDKLRHSQGFPGMRVLQFDVGNPDFDVRRIDANCVCYTGTHDNDTTVGWYLGGEQDRRSANDIARHQQRVLEVSNGHPESVHRDMIRLAFESPADLAIAPLQDFLGLGSAARFNTPGTPGGNWRWRMSERLSATQCDDIGRLVRDAGRGGNQVA